MLTRSFCLQSDLILLGISLLVGKMLVADRRVTLNEVLYRQAMAVAEQGMADGLGRVTLDPGWRASSACKVTACTA